MKFIHRNIPTILNSRSATSCSCFLDRKSSFADEAGHFVGFSAAL